MANLGSLPKLLETEQSTTVTCQCRRDPKDSAFDRVWLFNPSLRSWPILDGSRVLVTPSKPLELSKRLIGELALRLGNGETKSIVRMANLPEYFAEPQQRWRWQPVATQLQLLEQLLADPTRYRWLEAATGSSDCLLSLVHSRLLLPVVCATPPWHGSNAFRFDGVGAELGQTLRGLLTRNHLALMRRLRGIGSRSREREVVEAIWREDRVDRRSLFAARVVAEFLSCGSLESTAEFTASADRIWDAASLPDGLAFGERKPERIAIQAPSWAPRGLPDNMEIVGESVLDQCLNDERREKARRVLKRIAERFEKTTTDIVWVSFNSIEIEKRIEPFGRALDKISPSMSLNEIRGLGIAIDESEVDGRPFVRIDAAHWLAIQNRLPEAEDDEIQRLGDSGFKATAVFDVLLREKLRDPAQQPIWMARVYRILDTMADFDPEGVQRIRISFDRGSAARMIDIYSPIDRAASDDQSERKQIVAFYTLLTALSHAMTLDARQVFVHCEPVSGDGWTSAALREELNRLLTAAAASDKLEIGIQAAFIQNVNFEAFSIVDRAVPSSPIAFDARDMRYGKFVGIDVGGTNVKACLFDGSKKLADVGFIDFETLSGDSPVRLRDFVARVLQLVETKLELTYAEIDGIGLSWPGVVRDSRIAAASTLLLELLVDIDGEATRIERGATPEQLQKVPLIETFRDCLNEREPGLGDRLAFVLANDGDAEAYGNYCLLAQAEEHTGAGRWTIILKLGTSLAGGDIDTEGRLSRHIAEYSKLAMDFAKCWREQGVFAGSARNYISSIGVRDLSREFVFKGELLFGKLNGMNSNDDCPHCIEAIELGGLLEIWACLDTEVEGELAENQVLEEFVRADNSTGDGRYDKLAREFESRCSGSSTDGGALRAALRRYVIALGRREMLKETEGSDEESVPEAESEARGVKRLCALLDSELPEHSRTLDDALSHLDHARLARSVLGSVALFSQMGLQIAHLIVQLYNIYRSDRIHQVILAGGVLQGLSGKVIRRQTRAFLAKYYDKVYGENKNLGPDSILVADVANPNIVGPYGAAMLASSFHKQDCWSRSRTLIEQIVARTRAGDSISVRELVRQLNADRFDAAAVRACLKELVSQAELLPHAADRDLFIKPLPY